MMPAARFAVRFVARFAAAALCLATATAAASAEDAVSGNGDRLAGLASLDKDALAAATGGFRLGNLEIGINAVIRTAITDAAAAGAAGGFAGADAYALEPGMPAGAFRLDVPGTAITGLGLATIIENTQSNRAISRELTLNVEIAGLASALRAATAGRAIGRPTPRFR